MGKRIVYIVINLALGETKVKSTIQWLREKNIISDSKSDERTVQHILHYWKSSGGEFFSKVHTPNQIQLM